MDSNQAFILINVNAERAEEMSEENCSKMQKLISGPVRDKLPEMTEDQITTLEMKMAFMKNAAENDILIFTMKNEFWIDWFCYWGPQLWFEITKHTSHIEVYICCARDASKNRRFIQCE